MQKCPCVLCEGRKDGRRRAYITKGGRAANYVSTNGTRGHNRPRYEEGNENENEALHRNATIDKFACLCCMLHAGLWSILGAVACPSGCGSQFV